MSRKNRMKNKVGNFQAVFQVSHTVNQQLRAAVTNFIIMLPTLLSCHRYVGGQNSWELGGVEMEFLRII